jgi:hypothetical protein
MLIDSIATDPDETQEWVGALDALVAVTSWMRQPRGPVPAGRLVAERSSS